MYIKIFWQIHVRLACLFFLLAACAFVAKRFAKRNAQTKRWNETNDHITLGSSEVYMHEDLHWRARNASH